MKRWLERGLAVAALATVVWFFHWTARQANGFTSLGDWDYYNLLVRGFRQGHLHLAKQPSPELLALVDPYDPAQNGPHRLPDASYYRGHYYLYFGAAPAVVLMWPYAALTGRELPMGAATFVFCSVGFLAASGLWLGIRRRHFPDSAAWLAPLGVLTLGGATHVLALVQRPMWWELAIAAGYAFMQLALVAVYFAMHGRRRALALGAAGLCVGLAVASRPPALFGAALLLPPLWLASRERGLDRAWWRMAMAVTAMLGACLLAIFAYNFARFGNAFEFGQSYQLSGAYEGKLQHFSFRFIPHNLAAYFTSLPKWTWEFPFIAAQQNTTDIPGYFGSEEVVGLGVTFFVIWFAFGLPLAWRGRAQVELPRLRAMLVAMGAVFFGVGFFLWTMFSNTARYMADFAPALALLALCGMLGVERQIQNARSLAWRGFVRAGIAVVLVASLTMGVLVTFDYHGRSMARDQPGLWRRLQDRCFAAMSQAGVWARVYSGPRELKVRFAPKPAGTVEVFWRPTDPRADERIVVEHLGGREIRFGYARGSASVRWGRPVRWENNHTHTILVQTPSLYDAPAGPHGGLRARLAFRERSCVAVWFSGGRALGEIVAPLSGPFELDGAVASEFSGDVRSQRTRPFRGDEVESAVDQTVAHEVGQKPGGTLRLRVLLPSRLAAKGEPLFAAGALYGSDIVCLREANDGAVKLVFDHFGVATHESKPLPLDRSREHDIEIALPSFTSAVFGAAAEGEIILRVDGDEVMRQRTATYAFAPGSEGVGKNAFGTTCEREFRGWLLGARWMN